MLNSKKFDLNGFHWQTMLVGKLASLRHERANQRQIRVGVFLESEPNWFDGLSSHTYTHTHTHKVAPSWFSINCWFSGMVNDTLLCLTGANKIN